MPNLSQSTEIATLLLQSILILVPLLTGAAELIAQRGTDRDDHRAAETGGKNEGASRFILALFVSGYFLLFFAMFRVVEFFIFRLNLPDELILAIGTLELFVLIAGIIIIESLRSELTKWKRLVLQLEVGFFLFALFAIFRKYYFPTSSEYYFLLVAGGIAVVIVFWSWW